MPNGKAITGCFLCLLMLVCVPPARAMNDTPQESAEDIRAIFCPAIEDEARYDRNGFESYKMLIPGTDGWIFRTETDLMTSLRLSKRGVENIRALNKAFEEKGINLVMLVLPTRGMIHYRNVRDEERLKYGFTDIDGVWADYRAAIGQIREAGVDTFALKPPAEGEPFYYKRDHHWNSEGARNAAEQLAAFVKTLPDFQDVPRKEYRTVEAGEVAFDGVSKKVFRKLCGTGQPPETVTVRITEPVNATSGEDALFGEPEIPRIVLLGTSNSTMVPSYANFEGALREALGADLVNMSVSGGGLDTALISYLNSDYYKEHPATIAIWEVPIYYDISNQTGIFREALPAIYGSCGESAVVREAVHLDDKSVIALNRLAREERISGGGYYVHVRFEEPVRDWWALDLRYDSRDRDYYKFRRVEQYPHDGDFYLRLDDRKSGDLDKVVMRVPAGMVGMEARIEVCKLSGAGGNMLGDLWHEIGNKFR
ncbi:MAG: hypothetical protein EOM26_00105 [Alphaproteobacteria bacterium]|nr:hypothetical protein [Alphaproteobacteria bacterium]